jgi:hypothetical protein
LKIYALPFATLLLLAGCANMPSLNRSASVTPNRQANAFSTYLSARFAAGEHALPEAARYYTQSLKQDPGNASILSLAFFYTTTSGDVEGRVNTPRRSSPRRRTSVRHAWHWR